MERQSRLQIIALLLLILLAAALRFYRLDAQDIWGDEAFSIWLSQQSLDKVVAGAADTHPPFYPLLLFFWLRLVSTSAFATRTLSVLISILAIPLVFVFARRLSGRLRVAWLSAVLAAVSPLLIYYSQETRMYELVAVLALASAYFAMRVWMDRHLPLQGAYFVSTLLAIYTHYSAFFVVAAEALFAMVYLRKNRSVLLRWLLLQVALGAAYVPWIVVQVSFLRGKVSTRFDEWGWRGIEMIFGKTILAFSVGLTMEFPVAQIAAAAFLVVAALGVIAILRNHGKRTVSVNSIADDRCKRLAAVSVDFSGFAPLCFLVPIIIAYILNPVMPFFFERYVLVALPGFIVTVALGLDWLAGRDTRAAIGAIGILVLVSVFSLGNYYFNDAYAKGKYGRMMGYVASHAQLGDALVLNNPLQKPLYQYYAPRDIPAYFLPDGTPLEDPRTRQELEEIAHKHPRLWLVMFGNPAEYDPTGYLERWLGANGFKAYSGGYVDASLSLYVMPNAQTVLRQSLRATLGDSIQLLGYDLDRQQVVPGQTLLLTLHWQVTAPIGKRYTVFAHVIGGMNPATQSPVWAQMDNEPVGGSRRTTTWQVGETIDDRYGLLIPPNTPPGEYALEVGMYDQVTLARLPVRDETGARIPDDRVLLGTVRVLSY